MSTIPQDMTDAAVQLEHLAKRLANVLGDGSEEAWEQATQIHAHATTLRGYAEQCKVRLRAAVDDDAPWPLHTFEEPPVFVPPPVPVHTGYGSGAGDVGAPKDTVEEFIAFVAEDTRKGVAVKDDAPKQPIVISSTCRHQNYYCLLTGENECIGDTICPDYEPSP